MKRVIVAIIFLLASFSLHVSVVSGSDDSDGSEESTTAASAPSDTTDADGEQTTLKPTTDVSNDGGGTPAPGETTEQGPKPTEKPSKKENKKGKKGKDKKEDKKEKKKSKKKDTDESDDDDDDTKNEDEGVKDSLILGTYRLASSPKAKDFNGFLKAMEFSKKDRNKIRNAYMVTVRIEKTDQDGDEYSYKVHLGFKTMHETFTLGEEYETKLFDGREYNATVDMSGNVVTRKEQHDGFEATHNATFTKKGFTIEMTAKNKTAKQKYRRQVNFFESVKNGFEAFFKG